MTAGIPRAMRSARRIATSAIATLLLAAVSLIVVAMALAHEIVARLLLTPNVIEDRSHGALERLLIHGWRQLGLIA
jgi:hypothetical protein